MPTGLLFKVQHASRSPQATVAAIWAKLHARLFTSQERRKKRRQACRTQRDRQLCRTWLSWLHLHRSKSSTGVSLLHEQQEIARIRPTCVHGCMAEKWQYVWKARFAEGATQRWLYWSNTRK